MNKDNLIGLIGILVPGGFSVYSFLEYVKPVLGILGLILSLAVTVTVIILNVEKIKRVRQDRRINEIIRRINEIIRRINEIIRRINEMILKHSETRDSTTKEKA